MRKCVSVVGECFFAWPKCGNLFRENSRIGFSNILTFLKHYEFIMP